MNELFVQKVRTFLKAQPEGGFDIASSSIGDGAWELVITMTKFPFFEIEEEEIPSLYFDSITLTGSNGTNIPADDLWGQWDNIYFQATGRRWF